MFTVNTTDNALVTEFRRVFGECYVHDDGGLFAADWPESVRYDEDKAVPVLARFDDGHGATEKGDAEVCRALEAAGAVIG